MKEDEMKKRVHGEEDTMPIQQYMRGPRQNEA